MNHRSAGAQRAASHGQCFLLPESETAYGRKAVQEETFVEHPQSVCWPLGFVVRLPPADLEGNAVDAATRIQGTCSGEQMSDVRI